jgi:alpha-N-arabinofuranosidase
MRHPKKIYLFILILSFAALTCISAPRGNETHTATLVINADQGHFKISKHIYGHFSEHLGRCIYGGYWVGKDSQIKNTRGIRNDIVDALKKIKVPVLRWPGGCFADEYHWKDGIGPPSERPTLVNTHWGRVTENNHFGTHEFLDLCQQIGCEPYICGNVGSGTVREMKNGLSILLLTDRVPWQTYAGKTGRMLLGSFPFSVSGMKTGDAAGICGPNTMRMFTGDFRPMCGITPETGSTESHAEATAGTMSGQKY